MAKLQFDVIIVGAGPAGAVLGYLLAKSGVDVLLIEKDASFEKEFRGPAYQPCVVEYFNEMHILDELFLIDHTILHELKVTDSSEKLFSIRFDELQKPYNYAVAVNQSSLLKKLIQLASEFPNLTFLGNTTAADVVYQNGMISGVTTTIDGKKQVINSRLIVAADGRYSTMRRAAGIEMKKPKQQFDIVWFDLPRTKKKYELEFEISKHGTLIFIPQNKDFTRIGWVLKKGRFQQMKQKGLENFKNELIAARESLKNLLPALKSFDDCRYMEVKAAIAKQWSKDGLLLIGDAAHTTSPIGAQGNKLAIQDAVTLHPVIMQTLKNHPGIVRKYHLASYVKKRRKEASLIFRWQNFLAKGLIAFRNPFIKKVVLPIISSKILPLLAWGRQKVSVDRSWFQYQTDYGKIHRYYLLKIDKIIHETKDAVSFYFHIPKDVKEEFTYKAGQFITLRMLDQGQLHKRCYSLSSIPKEDPFLRITVKKINKGLISNYMTSSLQEGDEVLVLPPAGQFIPVPGASRYLMIAGGSGITPIMSLIRFLLKQPHVEKITLIYASHDFDSIIFKNDLDILEQTHSDKFQVIHNLSAEHPAWSGLTGRLNKKKILDLLCVHDLETEVYLCGPKGLMALAKEALEEIKVADNKIHSETYASLAEPFEEVHQKTAETPLIVGKGESAPREKSKSLFIKIYGKKHSIICREGESILDAAIRENLDPPFSCREGICSTCLAKLKEGKVVMERHQALSDNEAKSGKILTCQAKPLTEHCQVDYD